MLSQQCNAEINTIPGRRREREQLLRRFPGLLSIVARRYHVNRSTASRVFHGEAVSRRIHGGLRKYIQGQLAKIT